MRVGMIDVVSQDYIILLELRDWVKRKLFYSMHSEIHYYLL